MTTHCSWRGGGLTRGLRMAVTARISLSLASAVPSRESGDSACDGLFSGGFGVSVLLVSHQRGFSRNRRRRVGLTSFWGRRRLDGGCRRSCRRSLRGGGASPPRVSFHALGASLSRRRVPGDGPGGVGEPSPGDCRDAGRAVTRAAALVGVGFGFGVGPRLPRRILSRVLTRAHVHTARTRAPISVVVTSNAPRDNARRRPRLKKVR